MRSIRFTVLMLPAFLSVYTNALAQSKFAISATVTPFYSQTKSTVKYKHDDGSGVFAERVIHSEISSNGYLVGLNGRYAFSEKWSAATGLWFTNFGSNSNYSYGRSYYFSIPVMVNLKTSEKKISPYFSAGAQWNFATTSRLNIPSIGEVYLRSDETSRIAPIVAAGAIYNLSTRFSVTAQPTFTYFIPPSRIDMHTYHIGLQMQCMLKL